VSKYSVQYKSNLNVVYSCKYHVVWTPKYRRPVLVNAVALRLEAIIQEAGAEIKSEILALEVMPDHVHLLIEVDPQFGIHRAVKLIKGRSSRFLRMEFPHLASRLPTLWTHSYFVSTSGGAPLSIIKRYVENQKGV
jgi:putative transposase